VQCQVPGVQPLPAVGLGCLKLLVRDVPVVSSMTFEPAGAGAVVPIGGTLRVRLAVAGQEVALVPAPGECTLQGLDVASSFVAVGDGNYTFSLTVTEATPSAAVGDLAVRLRLMDPGDTGARSAVATTALARAPPPGVDSVPPVVGLACGPRNNSVTTVANGTLCFTCGVNGSEPAGCAQLWMSVNGGGYTSLALQPGGGAANVTVGPFPDLSSPLVLAYAVDAAGNTGPATLLTWRLDQELPQTVWRVTPSRYSNSTSAQFSFDCSKTGCSFSYSLDGGAFLGLGNSSASGGGGGGEGGSAGVATEADTGLAEPVTTLPLVAAVTHVRVTPLWLHAVNGAVTLPALADSNATLQFRLGPQVPWADMKALPVRTPSSSGAFSGGGGAAVAGAAGVTAARSALGELLLADLHEGPLVLEVRAVSASGVGDATPLALAWTVDVTAPVMLGVTLLPSTGPPGEYFDAVSVLLAASEPVAWFLYRVGSVPTGSTPNDTAAAAAAAAAAQWRAVPVGLVTVEGLVPGATHVLQAAAVDVAGNEGPPTEVAWAAPACPTNATLPSLTAGTVVPQATGQVALTWTLTPASPAAAALFPNHYVSYRVDNGTAVVQAAAAVSVTSVAVGAWHTAVASVVASPACARAAAATGAPPVAGAGNVTVTWFEYEPAPGVPAFVATPGPESSSVFGEFEVNATTARPRLQYSLDGSSWTSCAAAVRVGPLAPGTHTMRVRTVGGALVGGEPVVGGEVGLTWSVVSPLNSTLLLNGLNDGDHTLVVIASSSANGTHEPDPRRFLWTVDTVPPNTQAVVTSGPFTNRPAATVNASCGGEADPVLCTLCWWYVALPPGAGSLLGAAAAAQSCVGGAAAAALSLPCPTDGAYTVALMSSDAAGSRDPSPTPLTVGWQRDTGPPSGTVALADAARSVPGLPAAVVDSLLVNLTLGASEPTLGFLLTLDGVEQAPPSGGSQGGGSQGGGSGWTGPALFPGPLATVHVVVEGDHVLAATPVDLAGNAALLPSTVLVRVAARAPRTVLLGRPPAYGRASTLSLILGVAPGAGGQLVSGYRLTWAAPGGAPPGAPTSVPVAPLADSFDVSVALVGVPPGTYSVVVAAENVVGLVDALGVAATFTVDVTPPSSELAVEGYPRRPDGGPVYVNTSVPTLVLTGADALSPVTRFVRFVRVGEAVEGEWARVDASVTAVGFTLPDGPHRFDVRAEDAAGNVQPPPYDSVEVVVDTVPPLVRFAGDWTGFAMGNPVPVCVALEDEYATASGGARVFAVLDNGPPEWAAPAPGCVLLNGVGDGVHVVTVGGVDNAGNAGVPVQSPLVLDPSPPISNATLVSVPGCVLDTDTLVCNAHDVATFNATCTISAAGGTVGDGGIQTPCLLEVRTGEGGGGGVCAHVYVMWARLCVLCVCARHARGPLCGGAACAPLCARAPLSSLVFPTPPAPPPHCARPQWAVDAFNVSLPAECSPANSTTAPSTRVWTRSGLSALLLSPPTAGRGARFTLLVRGVSAAGVVGPAATAEWFVDTVPPAAAPVFVRRPVPFLSATTASFEVQLVGDASPGYSYYEYSLEVGGVERVNRRRVGRPVPNDAVVQVR
jgi:hypothetical protein